MPKVHLSPSVRLPDPHHRKIKAWAALHGVSLREALCLAIDALLRCPNPKGADALPAQLILNKDS